MAASGRGRRMSFIASKGFLVGATVAAFVVAGSAVAWYAATQEGALAITTSECGSVLGGRALDAARDDTGVVGGEPRRIVTYTVNASELAGGDLRACTSVGDLEVAPSDDGNASVVFVIHSDEARDRDRVADAIVRAAFVAEDGGLLLVAAHDERKRDGDDSISVDVRVLVPATGPYAFHLSTGVGDLRLDGLAAREIAASTGVGDIGVFDVASEGDVTLSTGVGDIETDLASTASSRVTAGTGTGDIMLFMPGGPDVGFEVHATTGVGSVHVDIGPTEAREGGKSTVGDDVRTRSKGYEAKATKVQIEANTGVGDVSVAS